MPFKKLLIANRGEIAIRIARAAGETGVTTVAIYPADDALSLHVRSADEAHEIPGRGARANLDIEIGPRAAPRDFLSLARAPEDLKANRLTSLPPLSSLTLSHFYQ